MNPDVGTVDSDGARRALSRGAAVVLPNPAPLTYTVAATGPRAVNTAKARPAEQAVALWAHDPGTLTALDDFLDLDAASTSLARRLLIEERVTLLVPIRPGTSLPSWLSPASQDGWTLLFGARWTPLLPVLADPILYVSSANRTGRPPAATAAEAIAMFPPAVAVLGSASLTGADRYPCEPSRAATTTLRLHPDGQLDLHRHGAQDHPYPNADQYLDRLRATHT
ncbi:hypothetical protein [Streptomyces violascens]|uniref:YrdC-like domain-containing protein n=1 Tax=Streptomyces violascens TaxID=67381 RepID=A0ABQ3QRF8_9ACTN|nr:hypothetical protein [Streptomyces violascens]GGU48778.1 hypothetical protein GCM10010289_81620 [Streptomyces violascens]GHI39851.1 hypothetical protein Sviol_42590 [Streptomyces violascens]